MYPKYTKKILKLENNKRNSLLKNRQQLMEGDTAHTLAT